MRSIARLAMQGPWVAAALAGLFALAGLMFAPSLLLGGGVVALVALRHGPMEVLRVAALATTGVAAAMVIAVGRIGISGLVILLPWVPVISASLVLRNTGGQGRATALLAIFVGGFCYAIRQAVPEVEAFWLERLTQLGAAITQQGGSFMTADEIKLVASIMHPATVSLMMLTLVGMVMLGRWWQATLYRPGGFGEEFRQFVLPLWVLPVAATIAVISLLNGLQQQERSGLTGDAMIVLTLLFALQGLAVVHARVRTQGLHRGWLIGLYTALGLVPQLMAAGLAITGIADWVADFRRLRRPAA